jgi:hypothetical protein
MLRQDLQDEQDGLAIQKQSPNGETLILTPSRFPILSILFILSKFHALAESFRPNTNIIVFAPAST